MQKYTANYANTSSNFVLQNLPAKQEISSGLQSACCIVRNILQRGKPSRLSHFLQGKIGILHEMEDWNETLQLIDFTVPQWKTTIKGDDANRYYPAREFFNALPDLFPDYPFLHNLLIPEVLFTDILDNIGKDFHAQQVDFYVSAAKLVIEIDGQQHKTHDATRMNDKQRDEALDKAKIKTIRIDTQDWREQNDRFQQQISAIQQRLQEFNSNLQLYAQSYEQLQIPSEAIVLNKLRPTAIMRLQILAIELIERGFWRVDDKEWTLQILNRDQYLPIQEACELALEDLWSWLSNALKLQGQVLTKPNVALEPIQSPDEWRYDDTTVRIDFSIVRRWTDEHTDYSRVVYLRADYFDIADKDYYTVSTSAFTPYTLIKDGEKSNYVALQFFLKNIFGYDDFNNGQFGIIQNALAGRSTIGLLPTGGGKSLCYQLAVFLQPAISFVVAPIKSLMYDQVDEMKKIGIDRVACITGDFSAEEKQLMTRAFEQGKYWFILISPERFQIENFREKYKALAKNKPLGFAVIDEVHCMSEWGHDFRTSYLNLVPTIRRFSPDIRLLGLTATASINVLRNIQVEFGELNNNNTVVLTVFSR
jgi:ATP-dependent DNA helicase RecQ